MSVPLRNDEPNLTRRDQMTVSAGAISEVPWGAAVATGAVVTGADLLLHLATGHIAAGSAMSAPADIALPAAICPVARCRRRSAPVTTAPVATAAPHGTSLIAPAETVIWSRRVRFGS